MSTGAVELQAMRELTNTMRGLATVLTSTTRALRIQMQQWWSLEELEHRWQLPKHQIVALFVRHFDHQPKRGVSPRFHLDRVLEMDEILRNDREPREILSDGRD